MTPQTASQIAEINSDIATLKTTAPDPLPEILAGWYTPHYLLSARDHLAAQAGASDRFRLLNQMAGNVVALQRGAYWSPRIQLDRERVELAREKLRHTIARDTALADHKAAADPDLTRPLSDAARQAIISQVDTLLGIK